MHSHFNKPELSIIEDTYFDVSKREFPVFDEAQGLISDTLIFSKGNPPVRQC